MWLFKNSASQEEVPLRRSVGWLEIAWIIDSVKCYILYITRDTAYEESSYNNQISLHRNHWQ